VLGAVVVPRQQPLTRAPAGVVAVAGALVAHVALAPLLHASTSVATLHAVATFAIGLGVAALSRWVDPIAYAGAYLVGAELLWRVAGARVPHEFGKYALVSIFGIGLLRLGRPRNVVLPLAYFVLLLPSIVLTVDAFGLAAARQEVSFNLSGPLALTVSVLFFARLKLSWPSLQRLLWSAVTPIVALATITSVSTIRSENLEFTNASNFVTSGGFGPNQVSAILGLGALFGLVLLARESSLGGRLLALPVTLWLLAQCVLTFSRGGLVNVVVALALAAAYSLREPKKASRLVAPMLAVVLLAGFVVYPRLVAFTGGALEKRFTDLTLEERDRLLAADMEAWRSSPLVGVGPGVGKEHRQLPDGRGVAAHTEFTRMLAEHGVAGAAALALLVSMVVTAYRRAGTPRARAWVLLLAGWALTEMAHGAMRVAAIPFVFGLMTGALERTDERPDQLAGAP